MIRKEGGPRGSALPALQRNLLVLLLAATGISLIGTPFPDLAPLQDLPVLLLIFVTPLLLRRWPISDAAFVCITVFLLLHLVGGRYAYSYVPYDAWSRALSGYSISDIFGLRRNGYDRLVHFAFGLLMVVPFREVLRRHGGLGAAIALYVAIEFVFAASALYEIFEWLLTMMAAGPTADAYNGQQGDMWDAQKDMACAGVGALTTGLILAARAR